MDSTVFYSEILRLYLPCSLGASFVAFWLYNCTGALVMFSGTSLVGLLRLAASLSYSRYGSHSVGINGLHSLIHLLSLGITIPTSSSVFMSLVIFLNSTNSKLSWAPALYASSSLPQLMKDRLLGCVVAAAVSGLLPTLSLFPFFFSLTLEIMSVLSKSYLLSNTASRLILSPFSISKPDHPLGPGESLKIWLGLYCIASAQIELDWLPSITSETPEDLKMVIAKVQSSDLAARLALLMTLAETQSASGLAADRELKIMKDMHSQEKLLGISSDPDKLHLRLKY